MNVAVRKKKVQRPDMRGKLYLLVYTYCFKLSSKR